MILISDIHGSYLSLIALLKKCPDSEVIFLGDLVDRGPRSKEVVQFAIDNGIRCIKGNHEHLMCSEPNETLFPGGETLDNIWLHNGGLETIKSYGGNDKLFKEHVEFLKQLPLYIEFDDVLLSHTGNGKSGRDMYEKVWMREIIDDGDKRIKIHGHSPVPQVRIDKISINIDTGCAYKRFGHLTALQWPSMKTWRVENCD